MLRIMFSIPQSNPQRFDHIVRWGAARLWILTSHRFMCKYPIPVASSFELLAVYGVSDQFEFHYSKFCR